MRKDLNPGFLGEHRLYHPAGRPDFISPRLQDVLHHMRPQKLELSPSFLSLYSRQLPTGRLTPVHGVFRIPPEALLARETIPVVRSSFRRLIETGILAAAPKNHEVHIALSAGMDSQTLAILAKKMGFSVTAHSLRSDIPGYCEWTEVKSFAKKYEIRCEEVNVTARDFENELQAFVSLTEYPIYNLHPVSKLLLAKAIAEKNISHLLTGDGADQILRHEWDCDLFPFTQACFDSTSVKLICPFVSESTASFSQNFGPFFDKEPIVKLAREIGLNPPPKKSQIFPGNTEQCFAQTKNLLMEYLSGGRPCAELQA